MPVNPDIAARYVPRLLSSLDVGRLDDAQLEIRGRDLIAALAESCRNEWHVQESVNRLVRTAKFCPTPCEVIAVATEILREYQPHERHGGTSSQCRNCYGSGWRSDDYLVTWPTLGQHGVRTRERLTTDQAVYLLARGLPPNQWILSAADYCECPAGDALRIARGAAEAKAEQLEEAKS